MSAACLAVFSRQLLKNSFTSSHVLKVRRIIWGWNIKKIVEIKWRKKQTFAICNLGFLHPPLNQHVNKLVHLLASWKRKSFRQKIFLHKVKFSQGSRNFSVQGKIKQWTFCKNLLISQLHNQVVFLHCANKKPKIPDCVFYPSCPEGFSYFIYAGWSIWRDQM